MRTVNADATVDNGTTATPPPVGVLSPIIPPNTVASIINVPPQIATTICWVALGVAIGWYLFRPQRSQVQR